MAGNGRTYESAADKALRYAENARSRAPLPTDIRSDEQFMEMYSSIMRDLPRMMSMVMEQKGKLRGTELTKDYKKLDRLVSQFSSIRPSEISSALNPKAPYSLSKSGYSTAALVTDGMSKLTKAINSVDKHMGGMSSSLDASVYKTASTLRRMQRYAEPRVVRRTQNGDWLQRGLGSTQFRGDLESRVREASGLVHRNASSYLNDFGERRSRAISEQNIYYPLDKRSRSLIPVSPRNTIASDMFTSTVRPGKRPRRNPTTITGRGRGLDYYLTGDLGGLSPSAVSAFANEGMSRDEAVKAGYVFNGNASAVRHSVPSSSDYAREMVRRGMGISRAVVDSVPRTMRVPSSGADMQNFADNPSSNMLIALSKNIEQASKLLSQLTGLVSTETKTKKKGLGALSDEKLTQRYYRTRRGHQAQMADVWAAYNKSLVSNRNQFGLPTAEGTEASNDLLAQYNALKSAHIPKSRMPSVLSDEAMGVHRYMAGNKPAVATSARGGALADFINLSEMNPADISQAFRSMMGGGAPTQGTQSQLGLLLSRYGKKTASVRAKIKANPNYQPSANEQSDLDRYNALRAKQTGTGGSGFVNNIWNQSPESMNATRANAFSNFRRMNAGEFNQPAPNPELWAQNTPGASRSKAANSFWGRLGIPAPSELPGIAGKAGALLQAPFKGVQALSGAEGAGPAAAALAVMQTASKVISTIGTSLSAIANVDTENIKALSSMFSSFGELSADPIKAMQGFIDGMGKLISSPLDKASALLGTAAGALGGGSGSGGGGGNPAASMIGAGLTLTKGFVDIASAGIKTAISIFQSLLSTVTQILKKILSTSPVFEAVENVLNLAFTMLFLPLATALSDSFIPLVTSLLDFTVSVGEQLASLITAIPEDMLTQMSTDLSSILANFTVAADGLDDTFWSSMIDNIEEVAKLITSTDFQNMIVGFVSLIPQMVSFVVKMAEFVVDNWDNIADAVSKGISAFEVMLENGNFSTFFNLVNNVMQDILDHPREIWQFITAGTNFMEHVVARMDRVLNFMQSINNFTDSIHSAVSGISDFFHNLGHELSSGLGGLWDKIKSGLGSFATGGYVAPKVGGTVIRVAEANQGEYIIPESEIGNIASGSSGTKVQVIFQGAVYGVDSLEQIITDTVTKNINASTFR